MAEQTPCITFCHLQHKGQLDGPIWTTMLCGPQYRSKLRALDQSLQSRARIRGPFGLDSNQEPDNLENFPVESQCRRLHFRGLLSYKRRVLQVYSNRNLHHQNHRNQILLHFRLFRFKKIYLPKNTMPIELYFGAILSQNIKKQTK